MVRNALVGAKSVNAGVANETLLGRESGLSHSAGHGLIEPRKLDCTE